MERDETGIELTADERSLVLTYGHWGDVLSEIEPQLESHKETPGTVVIRSQDYNWAMVAGSMSYEVRVMNVKPRWLRLEVLDLCDRIDAEIARNGYRWRY